MAREGGDEDGDDAVELCSREICDDEGGGGGGARLDT